MDMEVCCVPFAFFSNRQNVFDVLRNAVRRSRLLLSGK